MKLLHLMLLVLLVVCVACTTQEEPTTPTAEPQSEAQGVIVLGDIDADDPAGKIEELQPIIDYVASRLGDYGIGRGEVRIARDLDSMTELVGSGEIDLYYDSLYPALIVREETGAQPLVRGWRGGAPVYHTVFFARADSGLTSAEDMVGRMIAFDDEASTSGFMMPISFMVSNGLNPVEQSSRDADVPDDEVGYVFSGDDENTVEWVLSGIVDIGAADNLTYLGIPEATRDELVIIAETAEVPRRVVMIGPDIDDELANAVREILITMDEDEEGRPLLEIVGTTQFDEFPGGAESAFGPILEMFEVFNNR